MLLMDYEIEFRNPENDGILKKHSMELNEMWIFDGE